MNRRNIKIGRLLSIALGVIVIATATTEVKAQEIFSLDDILHLAQKNSLSAKQAENRKENKYWDYQAFKSTTLPQLTLTGNIPDYNRSIDPVTQPDGSTEFRATSQSSSDLTLSLNQNVAWTGGSLYLSSNLQRMDIFEGSNKGVTYAAGPIYLGIYQPLFQFNSLKWERQLAPIELEESKKAYAEEFEQINYIATQYYFNLMLGQVNLSIANINLANNDTIYKIGKGRYNLGKIAENELLLLELNLIASERDVASAKIELESSQLSLNTYIGRPKGDLITLTLPEELPIISIDAEKAIKLAKKNRQEFLGFKRQLLEAEREVEQAKKNSSPDITISGSYGLTQQAEDLSNVYKDPQEQQKLSISIQVPLVDWNGRKATIRTAEANSMLVYNTIEQEKQVFEQEIYVLAKKLPIIYDRVISTKRADSVGARQYEISRQRYLVANISVTDLNQALKDKDAAKREYLSALSEFWTSYYQLRMLTMYDFESNTPIVINNN